MAKRNVAFIKPDEPNFLKRMKAEIGYKDPDTIEAKRAAIENYSDDDEEYLERDDEKPQVVQLREGDLTEEEAARLAKEEAQKPADLSQKIVFKAKKKEEKEVQENPAESSRKGEKPKKKKKEKSAKSLLSFDEEEDGE